jgi:PA domain-containing protein/Big-like domain-containing protein/flagellar hook capping protein FlgD
VNGGAILGNFALIDRGTCTFVAKAQAAQAAGATGLIVANNVAAGLPGMGGADPTITIPCIGISQADGNAIKAQLAGGVNVTMKLDPTQKAGMDANNRTLMYAPNPFASGSSVSHFDISLSPNALQEPAINNDLHDNLDLDPYLFRDLGWFPDAQVSVAAEPTTGTCGEKVVLTATMSPTGEGKGIVEFLDGLTVLGQGDIINNTTATFSTTFTMGTHLLKARHKCFTCSTYVVSPELPFDVGCPTPALLSMFRADPLAGAIELRWQFGDSRFVDSWVERGPAAEGPWTAIATERRNEGATLVAVDRSAVAGTTYWYRLVARQSGGSTTVFGPLKTTAGSVVWRSELSAVRPNPGNGNFTFDFAVPRESSVRLSVLDVQGREVALLYNGSRGAGNYQAVWTGETSNGVKAAPGMYFVRYQALDKVHFSRVVLAR